jgi:hypothetical protein
MMAHQLKADKGRLKEALRVLTFKLLLNGDWVLIAEWKCDGCLSLISNLLQTPHSPVVTIAGLEYGVLASLFRSHSTKNQNEGLENPHTRRLLLRRLLLHNSIFQNNNDRKCATQAVFQAIIVWLRAYSAKPRSRHIFQKPSHIC